MLGGGCSLPVVRDLLLGRPQFSEFRSSPEGIASNIFSDRLKRLREAGVVERRPSAEHARRATDHLTSKGRALRPVLRAVTRWGLEHVDGTEIRMTPRP